MVISQGVELDNISFNFLMKVKKRVLFRTLDLIPVSRHQSLNQLVPKTNIDDIVRSFEKSEDLVHIANTLELISDVAYLYQLETLLTEYFKLKLATSVQASEAATKQ